MALSSPFAPEPPFLHGQAPATGLLLCNLGTPEAPTPTAVRHYLGEFLRDPRVVEIPPALWLPLLYAVILPFRAGRSAAKYVAIWTPDGSPLKVWTERQAQGVQQWLADQGHRVKVAYAMRYGSPSIASQLDALKAEGVTRILVLPLYPQYSGTTTASVIDAVAAWSMRARAVPELRFVNHYHDDRGYLHALARRIDRHWREHGRPDHLLMSFHGVPRRTLDLGDPYHCECQKTARLLASRLGLREADYSVTFQSRFGRAKWLEPYTEPSARLLARKGVGRLDVVCPGFASDCLETLEEINLEVRQAFLASGGKEFHYIPCLNDDSEWIDALGSLVEQHLAGWPTRDVPDVQMQDQSRERALAMGATA